MSETFFSISLSFSCYALLLFSLRLTTSLAARLVLLRVVMFGLNCWKNGLSYLYNTLLKGAVRVLRSDCFTVDKVSISLVVSVRECLSFDLPHVRMLQGSVRNTLDERVGWGECALMDLVVLCDYYTSLNSIFPTVIWMRNYHVQCCVINGRKTQWSIEIFENGMMHRSLGWRYRVVNRMNSGRHPEGLIEISI